MGLVETAPGHVRRRLGLPVSAGAWQAAAADALDAKVEELDLTIERLESHGFLELDLPRESARAIHHALGILRSARNDYCDDASQLRGAA